jgi:hypothetical protein
VNNGDRATGSGPFFRPPEVAPHASVLRSFPEMRGMNAPGVLELLGWSGKMEKGPGNTMVGAKLGRGIEG